MKKVFDKIILGKEKKPIFDPYLYAWTNTEGQPRTLGQLYTRWRGSDNTNMPLKSLQSEESNMESMFDKSMEMVFITKKNVILSYVQVHFE